MDERILLEKYSSIVETIRFTFPLLDENKLISHIKIQEFLKRASAELEKLAVLEGDEHFLKTLLLLNQQIRNLIAITDKKIGNYISGRSEKKSTEEANKRSHRLDDTSARSKKPKLEETSESHFASTTLQTPRVSGLSEIIGLAEAKRVLRQMVLLPRTQPQLFQNRRICNTVLLFGPPGTGKTRLVHALAAETAANLHCISSSDILSHYVGQTEKAIKAVFQSLQSSSDFHLLFIDEIDGLCRKRTNGEEEHTRRIKTEIMCQMSSVEQSSNVFMICATNCPWDLDTAILRRFQKRILIPLPNETERFELFKFFTKGESLEEKMEEWVPLLNKTEGYSGSDISDVVEHALDVPLNELEDTKMWMSNPDGFYEPATAAENLSQLVCSDLKNLPPNFVKSRKVHMGDLLAAADKVLSTVSREDARQFDQFAKKQQEK